MPEIQSERGNEEHCNPIGSKIIGNRDPKRVQDATTKHTRRQLVPQLLLSRQKRPTEFISSTAQYHQN